MTRPMNRECKLPEIGAVDREAGEFWVANPFQLPEVGHNLSAFERNRLFLSVAGESYVDASRFSSVDIDSDTRTVITADFDRDGRVDILTGNVGGGPLRLFLNRLQVGNNRGVRLNLLTSDGKRAAVGARVVAEIGERRIYRDVFPANGCMGQSPAELLLGVGDAEQIDRLTVRWPDGSEQVFESLEVADLLTITQGQPEVVSR